MKLEEPTILSRPTSAGGAAPPNPILVRHLRGEHVESVHRGTWVLADSAGHVIEGAGRFDDPVFVRSSVKCLQALPLLESGAAQRFDLDDRELALCLASHDGETCHTEVVGGLLARLGLGPEHLRCGAHAPTEARSRARLRGEGRAPTALHNNCSGKHAGFLALSLHLGEPLERYLDPAGAVQLAVRRAVLDLAGLDEADLEAATDGCSAPSFRMPLSALATAFARVASPERLAPARRAACERMLGAVARHPELVAGTRGRLCTDLARASAGRLFPKIGGEAVYAIGVRGGDRAIAIKIDDGATRALGPLVVDLLERFGLAGGAEIDALAAWRAGPIENWAGLTTGRVEVAG